MTDPIPSPASVLPRRDRWVVYARVSEAEHGTITALAARDGLTVSDYVRRCINAYLLDEPDDTVMLDEQRSEDHVKP